MKKEIIRERLRPFVATHKKVRLTRARRSKQLHNGFVRAVGRDLVILRQYNDFNQGGYTALLLKDITDIRSGEYEQFWDRMLTEEGLLDSVEPPYDVSAEDIPLLLRTLQHRGQNVIVECEERRGDLEDFYIGQILSVNGSFFRFANFDGLGRWDKDFHVIQFNEVTRVQFDTPYELTFSKYLDGPCPFINP